MKTRQMTPIIYLILSELFAAFIFVFEKGQYIFSSGTSCCSLWSGKYLYFRLIVPIWTRYDNF